MKIIHFITGLGQGGAEGMLLKLVRVHKSQGVESIVVSLVDPAEMLPLFQSEGIPVYGLGQRRGILNPHAITGLYEIIKDFHPDLIQTWMYHADLVATSIRVRFPKLPIVWNIRHNNLDRGLNRTTTIWTAKLCAMVSGFVPNSIICCNKSAKEIHASLGYDKKKIVIIYNGFDLSMFHPDQARGQVVRDEAGIPPGSLVVGLFARLHTLKGHDNFFQAWRAVPGELGGRPVHALLCGTDVTAEHPTIAAMTSGLDLDRLHFLGPRNDLPACHNALDTLCSPSASEGFPNVVGEAMASGVPCVVTDVGESRDLVGDTGVVVPAREPMALAAALVEMLSRTDAARRLAGQKSKERVQAHFGIETIAETYLDLYAKLVNRA